jgi:hypothetical protein
MINKYFKTFYDKYSQFFRFIFFLRYLFGLFIVAIILFLIIPSFLNNEKRSEVFKEYLAKNYEFKISKYESIKYKLFPLPNFEFTNSKINLDSFPVELNVKKLKIYPKLLSIYNNENFKSNKIVLNESNIILGTLDLKFIVKEFLAKKNKLYFDNLNIGFYDESSPLVLLENIKFTNFGFKKNIVVGNIFGKEFKAKVNKSLNKINFKIHKSGINVDVSLDEKNDKNSINGIFKSKILNTNLKFDFIYDEKSFNIYNSFFRSKNLSFESNNLIIFKPFLDIKSNFKINDINVEIFNKFKLEKLLTYKNLLKQINSKNEINFNSKKFSRNFVDTLDLKFDLAYGRLNYSKNISLSDNIFDCKGSVNLLEEFPLLFFDCFISSNTKRDFFKKFDIDIKKDNNIFNLNVKGNLSVINNKINFKEISMNNNYKASEEDLNYFKEKFENILFEDNFIKIFNLKKIKEFILEIS